MRIEPALSRGILERRYKRFLADIRLPDGRLLTVHCPNTGAMLGCAEPGSEVWYSDSANPSRKYRHTLEVVVSGQDRVGVNTARANRLVEEALNEQTIPAFAGSRIVRAEAPIPDESGRFDFLIEDAQGAACYL